MALPGHLKYLGFHKPLSSGTTEMAFEAKKWGNSIKSTWFSEICPKNHPFLPLKHFYGPGPRQTQKDLWFPMLFIGSLWRGNRVKSGISWYFVFFTGIHRIPMKIWISVISREFQYFRVRHPENTPPKPLVSLLFAWSGAPRHRIIRFNGEFCFSMEFCEILWKSQDFH